MGKEFFGCVVIRVADFVYCFDQPRILARRIIVENHDITWALAACNLAKLKNNVRVGMRSVKERKMHPS